MSLSEDAKKFIKQKRGLLIQKFANPELYKSTEHPVTIFMAGSPGAGKTEFSKLYVELLEDVIYKDSIIYDKFKIARIDADEIRDILPGYDGSNSSLFQEAITIGVNKLYDYLLKKRINALIDGTFTNEKYAVENIERSIGRGRYSEVIYIFQDPINSWKLTKAREIKEGRHIPLEVFVAQFFKARENVNLVKNRFKQEIRINLIIRDFCKQKYDFHFNVDDIDNFLKFDYNKEALMETLRNI